MTKVAVVFGTYQPYFVARLNAAAAVALEIFPIEITNTGQRAELRETWINDDDRKAAAIRTLFREVLPRQIPNLELRRKLISLLNEIDPDVIAVPAWSEPASLICLQWARTHGKRAITMSDSCLWDKPRSWPVEFVKRRLVNMFDAALTAGRPQTAYLTTLGMPLESTFVGFDVVDNDHFTVKADAARANRPYWLREYGLPDNYFLLTSRFISKKNLRFVLSAYALYQRQKGSSAWSLVMTSDGPLRDALERDIVEHQISLKVKLAGVVTYDELPIYYGLAGAFIQASTVEQWGLAVNEAMAAGLPVLVSDRCGCAADLIDEGVNGHTFSPFSLQDLCAKLCLIHENGLRETMGRRSRDIIKDWSPERFAKGLESAARTAMDAGPKKVPSLDLLLLGALARLRKPDDGIKA